MVKFQAHRTQAQTHTSLQDRRQPKIDQPYIEDIMIFLKL